MKQKGKVLLSGLWISYVNHSPLYKNRIQLLFNIQMWKKFPFYFLNVSMLLFGLHEHVLFLSTGYIYRNSRVCSYWSNLWWKHTTFHEVNIFSNCLCRQIKLFLQCEKRLINLLPWSWWVVLYINQKPLTFLFVLPLHHVTRVCCLESSWLCFLLVSSFWR